MSPTLTLQSFLRSFLRPDASPAIRNISTASNETLGNGHSDNAQFSANGRYVVFQSDADNLVAGDTNNSTDIFRKDLVTGKVIRLFRCRRRHAGKQLQHLCHAQRR